MEVILVVEIVEIVVLKVVVVSDVVVVCVPGDAMAAFVVSDAVITGADVVFVVVVVDI